MKNVMKLSLTAAVLAGSLVLATPVRAESTTTQTVNGTNVNNSSTTVICNTGAYGTNNCYSTTTQNILGATTDRSKLKHNTVNTSADSTTMAGVAVTMITTAAGAVVTVKSKFSK